VTFGYPMKCLSIIYHEQRVDPRAHFEFLQFLIADIQLFTTRLGMGGQMQPSVLFKMGLMLTVKREITVQLHYIEL
jgi:hypothetical protein